VSAFLEHSQNILPRLLEAMVMTLQLTLGSALFGIVLGLIIALARLSKNRLLGGVAGLYVTIFRGTPLLLQILFFWGLFSQLTGVQSALIAFSLNAGAYIAEIIRGAVQSIDRGQMEAARSLGMSYGLAMRRIILPQTFRRLLPPMVNELAALTKDTSLASAVGVVELMKQSSQFVARTARVPETYVWTALGYLIVTVALTSLANHLEKKLEVRG
jgi:His/Glu/Gln/Arg/opine family amino acid ABC transporter permease subunit